MEIKKLLIIPLFFIYFLGGAQTESVFRTIDWWTNVDQLEYLTDSTYRFNVFPLDFNDPGAGNTTVGLYFADFVGHRYKIIASTSTSITVLDEFRKNIAPQSEQAGKVYQSVYNGEAPYISALDWTFLDKSLWWKIYGEDMELMWRQTIDSLWDPVNMKWLYDGDTIPISTGSEHDPVTLAGSYDYITIANQVITRNAIDLTSHVTGLLPDANIASASTWNNHITNDGDLDNTNELQYLSGAGSTLSGFILTLTDDPTPVTLPNESDPVFTAWDKDYNDLINLPTLFTPTTLLADYGFVDNSTNWDAAYSWGDHSLVGYLTSFTESDPIFTVHTVYNISNGTGLLRNNGSGTWTYDNSTYLTSYTETDPIFGAHTVSNIINGVGRLSNDGVGNWYYDNNTYLTSYTETDPIFTAWDKDYNDLTNLPTLFTPTTLLADYGFTDNSVNWDDAYSWGDHSLVGYLTSYTETDPIFIAHTVYNITNGTGLLKNDGAGNWTYDNSVYLTSYTESDPIFTAWDKDYNDLINLPTIPTVYNSTITLQGTAVVSSPQSFTLNQSGGATITIDDTNTQLTQEEVEDYVGGMLTGTQTHIAVSYDDTNGELDFVVSDDWYNTLAELQTAVSNDFHNLGGTDLVDDADADALNEIQVLDAIGSTNAVAISLSRSGGSFGLVGRYGVNTNVNTSTHTVYIDGPTLNDDDPTNEAWTISDGTYTEQIANTTVSFIGAGLTTTSYNSGINRLTITSVGDGYEPNTDSQDLGFTASTGAFTISGGTGVTVGLFGTSSTDYGLVQGSNGVGATYFLNANGGWSVPAGGADEQDLSYTGSTGTINITNGTSATIGEFDISGTDYGFVQGSNGVGSAYFLNANGDWAVPDYSDLTNYVTTNTTQDVTGTKTFSNLYIKTLATNFRIYDYLGTYYAYFYESNSDASLGLNLYNGSNVTVAKFTTTGFELRDNGLTPSAANSNFGKLMVSSDVLYFVDDNGTSYNLLEASGNGTVTSVGISSTDLSVSGSPITTSGTITLNLNANSVDLAELNTTGTPSSSTYLRGDMVWATPPGGSTYTVYSSGGLGVTSNQFYITSTNTSNVATSLSSETDYLMTSTGSAGGAGSFAFGDLTAVTVYTSLVGTDEFYFTDVSASQVKKLDLDVLEAYMQNNLTFGGSSTNLSVGSVTSSSFILQSDTGNDITFNLTGITASSTGAQQLSLTSGDMYKSTYDGNQDNKIDLANGGTAISSITEYELFIGSAGGTYFDQVSGTGTTGQVLTSNGSGAMPTWQTPTTTTGDGVYSISATLGSGTFYIGVGGSISASNPSVVSDVSFTFYDSGDNLLGYYKGLLVGVYDAGGEDYVLTAIVSSLPANFSISAYQGSANVYVAVNNSTGSSVDYVCKYTYAHGN